MAERRLHLLTLAIVGAAALTLSGCAGDADTPDMQPPATATPGAQDEDRDDDQDTDQDADDTDDAAEDAAESAGGAAACEVLSADRATASMVFNPVIPEMATVAELEARLGLMDDVGAAPTADLAEDWALWGEFLQTARDGSEASDYSWFPAGDDVEDARDDLFEFYTDNCF